MISPKISEIFTKIRSTLNEREDALFKELDNLYEKKFIKEDIIKKGEKMPNQIKLYLDKGKELNEDWNDDNKLINNINNSINIENNILMNVKSTPSRKDGNIVGVVIEGDLP